ncbi:MAG: AAA family ATPase [Armatimonadota bacterium]|nr:MAG: AAA family ATPase [Armatimonadota bacterium]
MPIEDFEVALEHLRASCETDALGFETTADLPELKGTVGQDRAMAAIDFGLEMKTKGYNIFAAGPTGTGRNFAVCSRTQEAASKQPTPDDWCYVYNFDNPRQPRSLRLPPGRAVRLREDVEALLATLRQELPGAFESEAYEERKERAVADVQAERNRLLRELDEEARGRGLMIQATPMGFAAVPLADGSPMLREQFEQLPEEERKAVNEKMEMLRDRIQETVSQVRQLEKEARRRIQGLDREVAMLAIGDRFEEVKAQYREQPEVVKHLERVAEDVVSHLAQFRTASSESEEGRPPDAAPARYQVNVLVSHDENSGAPVIREHSPTYYNLMGRSEYRPVAGGAVTDHTLMKPGALHRANGGYLILQALDVLASPFAWEALKRSLRSEEAVIENIGEQWTPIPAATLRPEPIPLDVKVVLVGSPLLYFLLYHYEEEFGKLFKVKADFDVDMAVGGDSCRSYAAFIATHCRDEGLRQLTKAAVARVVEHGMRLASDQEKLSTRFAAVADMLAEANFWASQEKADLIDVQHVEKALEEKEYRSRRMEDRLFEFIARGDLILQVDGQAEGQVNGLAVLDVGDYAFGRPARITARVTPGRAGVVNIEREARMSGQIHHKAVMILSGYLLGTYAEESPLSLSATIAFEQSYEMVEGDSASCAELYAILSSLSGAPIRQGVAVTGSVDQNGRVQPIGGANQKIEGFYAACKLKGLTGDQGVMIPRQNVKNLMLKPEVVQAVKDGKFRIWAVSHVDEGIEVLTDLPAGAPDKPKTIHGLVAKRLREFSDALRGAREDRTTHIIEVPPSVGEPRPPAPPPPGPPIPPR